MTVQRLGIIGAACGVLACGSAAPAPVGRVGVSIALLKTGELAVVNPDLGSVSFLDPGTLRVVATVSVGGHPSALLETHDGSVWLVNRGGGQLTVLDAATHAVRSSVALCDGPAGLAEAPDGTWVAVACEWSGTVLRVDSVTRAVSTLSSGLKRPRAVAVVGTSVIVGEFISGQLTIVTGKGAVSTVPLVPATAPYRPALTRMTANLTAAIVPGFNQLFVTHELVNHTGDTGEAVADDYGTVLNGTPKINAAVTSLTLKGETPFRSDTAPPVYARFDIPAHALSGPVAAAPFGDRFLLVAHLSTNDVAVLDTRATDSTQRLLATYGVGAGPSGIAVDAAGQVAYVDNAFDGSISRLDLTLARSPSAPLYAATQTQVRTLPTPYSAAALAGRKLFYDATNPHVTPSRVVACATCHPGGADDGLVWFIHTASIPLKRRRTPHLANASSRTAPFHWDGAFPTMSALANATVTGLMAGDDLLVDVTGIQAYVDEIVERPSRTAVDSAAVARGAVLFASSGCAVCHAGPDGTDNLNHAVLNPPSLSADETFGAANTPALHGLFDRAPFFHDGRSAALPDVLTRSDAAAHFAGGALTAGQVADLVVYLETL